MKKQIDENDISKLISNSDALKLFSVVMVATDNGYELFNSYKIVKNRDSWTVLATSFNINHDFFNLKNAATFCVFHYSNLVLDAEQTRLEDRKLGSSHNNLLILKHLSKKYKKSEKFDIYNAKITECEAQINQIMHVLKYLWFKSKNIQMNKFSTSKINTL